MSKKKKKQLQWELPEEKVTCPACGGCGKEPISLDGPCDYCYGSGKVTLKTKKWMETLGY